MGKESEELQILDWIQTSVPDEFWLPAPTPTRLERFMYWLCGTKPPEQVLWRKTATFAAECKCDSPTTPALGEVDARR